MGGPHAAPAGCVIEAASAEGWRTTGRRNGAQFRADFVYAERERTRGSYGKLLVNKRRKNLTHRFPRRPFLTYQVNRGPDSPYRRWPNQQGRFKQIQVRNGQAISQRSSFQQISGAFCLSPILQTDRTATNNVGQLILLQISPYRHGKAFSRKPCLLEKLVDFIRDRYCLRHAVSKYASVYAFNKSAHSAKPSMSCISLLRRRR